MVELGLHGKLPAHGDFVGRGLGRPFIKAWDRWICEGLLEAEASQGATLWAGWHHRAPRALWIPPGHLCRQSVTGLVLASSDAVGRQFPLALLALGAETRPNPGWYRALAAAGARALAEGASADRLRAWLSPPPPNGLPPGETLIWEEGTAPRALRSAAGLFAPPGPGAP